MRTFLHLFLLGYMLLVPQMPARASVSVNAAINPEVSAGNASHAPSGFPGNVVASRSGFPGSDAFINKGVGGDAASIRSGGAGGDTPVHGASSGGDAPIRIVLNNWTSQMLLSRITGRIFEKMGYKVEYPVYGADEQWGALNRGIAHVQMEVWEGTNPILFQRMIRAGGVVDAGTHDAWTREDWWYPAYVEEICPGLPDWRALNACYKLFAGEETESLGRYLAGPWEQGDRARIRALGLKFKVVELADGDALKKRLMEAVKEKKPIVLFNWTPSWVEARFEGRFVEFPDYEPECETDPAWGVNRELHHDCGNPKSGWLKKAAWSGMAEKWPCAFETLLNINFDNAMISKLALMVDVDARGLEEAADLWMENNGTLWRSWIPEPCGPAGKAGATR